jgi:hypothetical protein
VVDIIMAYLPTMYTKFVTVTATQIKAMNTAPVTIVSGVAGQVINVESLLVIYNYNSVAFNPQADDLVVVFLGAADGSNTAMTQDGVGTDATGFVDQTESMASWQANWPETNSPSNDAGTDGGILSTVLRGSGLYLTQYNITDGFPTGANWTSGDGTLLVFVRYSLIEA